MIRVRCPWTAHDQKHPLLLTGTAHPSIEYLISKDAEADLEFLHTIPELPRGLPVMLHIEEMRTLFWKAGAGAILDKWPDPISWFKIRRLISSYGAVVSHLRMTIDGLKTLFLSPTLNTITRYVRLGIASQPDTTRPGKNICFLFTNSHHGDPTNLVRRGGYEILDAFNELRKIHPNVELVILMPKAELFKLPEHVTAVNRRVTEEELTHWFNKSHAMLLPSIDLHSHSLLRAMSHGCIPIISDAPGFSEFVNDAETGIIVRGRLVS